PARSPARAGQSFVLRTSNGAEAQLRTMRESAKSQWSRAVNARRVRKSYRGFPPVRRPTLLTKSLPAAFPFPSAAPQTLSPTLDGYNPARATPSGRVFHSLSTATLPTAQTPQGSCTQAGARSDVAATHWSKPPHLLQ